MRILSQLFWWVWTWPTNTLDGFIISGIEEDLRRLRGELKVAPSTKAQVKILGEINCLLKERTKVSYRKEIRHHRVLVSS
jgi:hypothetical protein